jgi:DHA2 family multidrug resistance protein-like MFS transporter
MWTCIKSRLHIVGNAVNTAVALVTSLEILGGTTAAIDDSNRPRVTRCGPASGGARAPRRYGNRVRFISLESQATLQCRASRSHWVTWGEMASGLIRDQGETTMSRCSDPVSILEYKGDDKLIAGIVLSVVTFWLFAQTTFNVLASMRTELRIGNSVSDIAVSVTALFTGAFIVVAGGLADRFGRVKVTTVGLALSAIGSLLIAMSPCGTAVFLMAGRMIQGLSAACIMPATLSLMNAYYDGEERQRALSFWSIGSWGGSGLCALLAGAVDSTIGWRWIFWMSTLVAVVSWTLIRGTPESKVVDVNRRPIDWTGTWAFVIAMVALHLVVAKGAEVGWLSTFIVTTTVISGLAATVFVLFERRASYPVVDFSLFGNSAYTASTLSNFFLNGVAGALLIALLLVQSAFGLSSLQSGLMTAGYLVAILVMIRVGEKLQQRWGCPRRPMVLGCATTVVGLILLTVTSLPVSQYVTVAFFGFTLIGAGLGIYATPSTDAALSSVAESRSGAASGIYKMASSLGTALGVATSAAIFEALANVDGQSAQALVGPGNDELRLAAAAALWFNVAIALLALAAVVFGMPRCAAAVHS